MDQLFLTQMVNEPTRGNNTLDLIFATCSDLIRHVYVRSGISDHESVFAEVLLKAKTTKKNTRTVFMYDKADKEIM